MVRNIKIFAIIIIAKLHTDFLYIMVTVAREKVFVQFNFQLCIIII